MAFFTGLFASIFVIDFDRFLWINEQSHKVCVFFYLSSVRCLSYFSSLFIHSVVRSFIVMSFFSLYSFLNQESQTKNWYAQLVTHGNFVQRIMEICFRSTAYWNTKALKQNKLEHRVECFTFFWSYMIICVEYARIKELLI